MGRVRVLSDEQRKANQRESARRSQQRIRKMRGSERRLQFTRAEEEANSDWSVLYFGRYGFAQRATHRKPSLSEIEGDCGERN